MHEGCIELRPQIEVNTLLFLSTRDHLLNLLAVSSRSLFFHLQSYPKASLLEHVKHRFPAEELMMTFHVHRARCQWGRLSRLQKSSGFETVPLRADYHREMKHLHKLAWCHCQ